MSDREPPDGGGPLKPGPSADSTTDFGLRNRKKQKAGKKSTPSPAATANADSSSGDNTRTLPAQNINEAINTTQAVPQQEGVLMDVVYVPPNRIVLAIPKWLAFGLLFIFATAFVAGGGFLGDYIWKEFLRSGNLYSDEDVVSASIGEAAVNLFKQFDRESDGKLSLSEYEALYHTLSGSGFNATYEPQVLQEIEDGDEMVTVEAAFKPLLLETMTKDMDDTFSGKMDSLKGLKSWNSTVVQWRNFGTRHFAAFVPSEEKYIYDLGTVYTIYKNNDGWFTSSFLSSNRYYPPQVEDRLVILHSLLGMFHKRPFLRTRFPPHGGTACIRAYNDHYVDIVFRIHAEFQLNELPHYPFWFSPGQFTGHLVISRDYKKILYFHMYVPNDKKLNIDMEWLNGPLEGENMEVDIGYMPQMEAMISAPSILVQEGVPKREFRIEADDKLNDRVAEIKWTKEITMEQARRNLEVEMYPFKKVEYHNFTDAFDKAQKEQKLVHSILLWGALDDQSC